MSVIETLPPSGGALLPALRLLPAPPCEPPYDDEDRPAPVLRLVPPTRLRPVVPGDPDDEEPARTARTALPEPRRFAQALVQRLLEVQAGVRPLPQLQRDTTPELYRSLERRGACRSRTVGPRPTARSVRSVHVQEREDAVAEVCATVLRGSRAAALALRLEGREGRWLCTELIGL